MNANTPALQLTVQIAAAGIPIDGVAQLADGWRIDFKPEATEQQRTQAQAIADAFDPVASDLAAVKDHAKEYVGTRTDEPARLARGIVLAAIDEINSLRDWITQFKAAVAAAGTLAQLKTSVAGLPNMPQRTATQAKNAVMAKIDDEV